MKAAIEERTSALLRDLRRKKGMTLDDFEAYSGGAIKSVVLGSYERGTRAISLARLEQLAALYEVPVEYFFTVEKIESNSDQGRYVFDLRRIKSYEVLDETLELVRRYLVTITNKRSDWNGEVISLRSSDSELLTFLSDLDLASLSEMLRINGFLFARRA